MIIFILGTYMKAMIFYTPSFPNYNLDIGYFQVHNKVYESKKKARMTYSLERREYLLMESS
jgi:hypothetical protein